MRLCEVNNCSQPVFGTCKISRKGYCKFHQALRLDHDKRSILQRGLDKAKKKQRIEVDNIPTGELIGVIDTGRPLMQSSVDNAMWEWFKRQRPKMKGFCSNCGGKTMKDDDEKFHYSIAHLLPKNFFKSIATNDFNWIELCYYGRSCHANYDNHMIDLTDLNCFDEVITKFVAMYPSIDKKERRRIPSVLLQYIETEI